MCNMANRHNKAKIEDGDSEIVAFRIPKSQVALLEDRMAESRPVNIRSHHQYARKVILDFLGNRCLYLNPNDQSNDPALAT